MRTPLWMARPRPLPLRHSLRSRLRDNGCGSVRSVTYRPDRHIHHPLSLVLDRQTGSAHGQEGEPPEAHPGRSSPKPS
jgi:hypothetical protein